MSFRGVLVQAGEGVSEIFQVLALLKRFVGKSDAAVLPFVLFNAPVG